MLTYSLRYSTLKNMKKLLEYLNSMDDISRKAFGVRCGTTFGYLRKACSPGQPPLGPRLCAKIEQASRKKITRMDLRPNDWAEIWPELARKQAAKIAKEKSCAGNIQP